VLELRRNRFGQPLPNARDVSLRRRVIQQGHLAFRLLRRLLAELHVFIRGIRVFRSDDARLSENAER
jgi:hypothetical protein